MHHIFIASYIQSVHSQECKRHATYFLAFNFHAFSRPDAANPQFVSENHFNLDSSSSLGPLYLPLRPSLITISAKHSTRNPPSRTPLSALASLSPLPSPAKANQLPCLPLESHPLLFTASSSPNPPWLSRRVRSSSPTRRDWKAATVARWASLITKVVLVVGEA